VWQAFADRHKLAGLAVYPVALDAIVDRVKAAVESLALTISVIVDPTDRFGRLYGFDYVPAGFLIDGSGRLVYEYRPPLDPLIDFAQGDAQVLADLEQLVGQGTAPPVSVDITTPAEHTTPGLSEFVKGVELLRKGRRVEALKSWRTAAALEPDNLVWRNHLWRALNPDRFDLGNLDLVWQEQQLAREEEFGIVAANPMPDEKAE
jgi:hypothetical protein